MFHVKKKIFAVICLLLICWFVVKPALETAWSTWMGFVAMHTYEARLERNWKIKSTDFLIGKLRHPSIAYSGVAASILRDRKEPQKADKLERVIKYGLFPRSKTLALSVLFVWDENRATELAMKILQKGRKHSLFQSAMAQLAYRKYEPAYSYVLELAKAPDRYDNGSVAYLKDFGKLASLPILQEMLEKPGISSLDKRIVTGAIEAIKKQNEEAVRE